MQKHGCYTTLLQASKISEKNLRDLLGHEKRNTTFIAHETISTIFQKSYWALERSKNIPKTL